MFHKIYDALERGKEVRMVYLDISKAFDKVWHKGLLYKLESVGVRGGRTLCRKTFCRKTFCRTDILPTDTLSNGHFVERTFRRKDILPKIEKF